MKLIDRVHGRYVFDRRTRVLSQRIAELLPRGARVLDVGCGNGRIARLVMDRRPDVDIRGIDVLVREETFIPVTRFDGVELPFAADAFDAVSFVDVLHHTDDPMVLLREAVRVSRGCIVIKDHLLEGWLAGPTLRLMDAVGNARFGVRLPYNYWARPRWEEALRELDLRAESWTDVLRIYPFWADWLFGRSLHFVARLGPRAARSGPAKA